MKKDVSSLLLIGLIVFSISLLWVVECVPIIDTFETVPEGLRHIADTAKDDASTDVRTVARVDACLWLSGGFCLGIGGGCLLGSLGIVGAYFYQPSPHPTRLVGKPPEYIDFYVTHYKRERNRAALGGACLGCTAGAVTAGCLVTPWATVLGTFAGRIADGRGW
jgi:hypothetical protein